MNDACTTFYCNMFATIVSKIEIKTQNFIPYSIQLIFFW